MITPAQCRAARGLVNYSQEDLAKRLRASTATIEAFEAGTKHLSINDLRIVRTALERLGIRFIDADPTGGDGVRFELPIAPPMPCPGDA